MAKKPTKPKTPRPEVPVKSKSGKGKAARA
jgi:hypothetical protein